MRLKWRNGKYIGLIEKRNPVLAGRSIYISQKVSGAGKLALGLNGAGITISIALIITSYVSIPQYSSSALGKCETIFFLSDAIVGGAKFAGLFSLGGLFSSFGVIVPTIVGIYRNLSLQKPSVKYRLSYIRYGDELIGLTERDVYSIGLFQAFFVAMGWLMFISLTVMTIFLMRKQNPAQIAVFLDQAKSLCNNELYYP